MVTGYRWRPFLPVVLIFIAILCFPPQPSYTNVIPHDAPRTALLLTAHPDDEVMFFTPTILSLVSASWTVRGLCLSVGNSSGLGEIRREELYRSYEHLGVDPERVQAIDHPQLQDGMENQWDPMIISTLIKEHLSRNPASMIITFDHSGITNHPNHTPLPAALSLLASSIGNIAVLHLHSPSRIFKFTGPLYAVYYILLSHFSRLVPGAKAGPSAPSALVAIIPPRQWLVGIGAMLQHESQLVWFRWLYLAFSRLMWVNELILAS